MLNAIDADISGTTAMPSAVIELGPQGILTGVAKTTGTVNGGWQLYVSNGYNSRVAASAPSGARDRFSLVTDPTIVAYLAKAFAGTDGGFKPNGSAGDGNISVLLGFAAAYLVFTPTAGAGHVNLDLNSV